MKGELKEGVQKANQEANPLVQAKPEAEQKQEDAQRQNLRHLDLSNSDINKADLIELINQGNFKKHTTISLPKSADDEVLAALANACPGLISLDLSSCDKITDKGLKTVATRFPELTTLSLGYCEDRNLVEHGLGNLAKKFPNLTINVGSNDKRNFGKIGPLRTIFRSLSISSDKEPYVYMFRELEKKYPKFISSNFTFSKGITYEGMIELRGCTKLQTINFGFCSEIINFGIQRLAEEFSKLPSMQKLAEEFSKLPSLDLRCLDITDTIFSEVIKKCSKLDSISLAQSSHITDKGINELVKACPNLTNINLAYCEKITDAAIEAIVAGCPGLKSLNLAGCKKITDAAIVKIADRFRGLTLLKVADCENITDKSLIAIGKKCLGLKLLDVANSNITDTGLQEIAKGCSELESLDLGGCKNISIAGIEAIVKGCSKLSSLVLPAHATDAMLELIAKKCKNLTNIEVSGTYGQTKDEDKITDRGVVALARECPKLKTIELSYRQNITDSSLQALAKCPELTKVGLFGNEKITAMGVESLVLNPKIEIRYGLCICPSTGLCWPSLEQLEKIIKTKGVRLAAEQKLLALDNGDAIGRWTEHVSSKRKYDSMGFEPPTKEIRI